MATPNPMEKTFRIPPPPVSQKVFLISGILTTVYGLEELENLPVSDVACLWLLHPRLQTQECMKPLAGAMIAHWNKEHPRMSGSVPGLIAVSFDQRNHGSRELDRLANEAWKSGNARHAQDMFSIYHGTSVDTSLLLDYLPSYVFPGAEHTIQVNLVCGVSLGGHAAWQCLFHDPRITAAIVVIGCPDYISLLCDRARLSKLSSWMGSSPSGSRFLGSQDFPESLINAVKRYDPAAIFSSTSPNHSRELMTYKDPRFHQLAEKHLCGKKVLNMAGGADKLVPYACAEPFLLWLKGLAGHDELIQVENIVFTGVGHEMSTEMVSSMAEFITKTLGSGARTSDRSSKI